MMPSKWVLRRRLAILRGRDGQLHRQIAAGYARGMFMGRERSEQVKVRNQIVALEKELEQER